MEWLTCRISRICVAILVAAIPTLICECPADAGAFPGATTQSTSDVITSLRQFSQEGKLELSTLPTSATDQFSFVCFAKIPSLAPEPFELSVVRNKKRASLVVCSINGGCYWYSYVTNGLLLAVDYKNPDSLVRLRGTEANPGFTFGPANGSPMWFAVGSHDDKPEVSFCPGAIIDQMIPAITSASFDTNKRVYSILTRHSTVHIELFPANAKAPMPFCQFAVKAPTQGFGVDFLVSGAPLPSPSYSGMLRDPDRIDDAVDQVGVKIVNLEAGGPNDVLRLVPPEAFPNGRYADTSDRLRLIVLGESCASGNKLKSPASPSDTPGSEIYKALCQQIKKAGHLRLSSGSDTYAKKFAVDCNVRSGPDCVGGCNLAFIRDNGRNAVAVSDVRDHQYDYMTDGFMVAVDLNNPGGLVVVHGMSPWLSVSRPGRKGDDLVKLKLMSRSPATSEMDVTELMAPNLQGVRRILYDPADNSYLFVGDNGMGEVTFRTKDSESPLPIRACEPYRINNSDLWIGVHIDTKPGTWDYFSVTPQAVARAGLPVRELSTSEAASLPLFPPADFEVHPGYIAASNALRSLISKELIVPEDAGQQKETN